MATDATGTPTTNVLIPKYNTSVDAPSGLGFNAAMDAIDLLFNKRTKQLTAAGDIVYATGADTPTRLPVGSNGTILTVAGGVPTWAAPATTSTVYRKTTTKQVLNTVTETDLLNGEITIAAGVMGSTGMLRLTAFGDWIQNSGAARDVQRFKLKLGGTTLIDTNTFGGSAVAANVSRWPWRIVAEIYNTATNVQNIMFSSEVEFATNPSGGLGATTWVTGEGKKIGMASSSTETYIMRDFGFTTAAIDTTAARLLELTVINPTATATCDFTLKNAIVEII